MRHKIKKIEKPKYGDRRIIEKFLFWPKKLTKYEPHDGDPYYYSYDEWRWLRKVKIKQVWSEWFPRTNPPTEEWCDDCWANEDE